jgi:hypothetical protein
MSPACRTLLALGQCERMAAATGAPGTARKQNARTNLLRSRQGRQRHSAPPGRHPGDPRLAGAQRRIVDALGIDQGGPVNLGQLTVAQAQES